MENKLVKMLLIYLSDGEKPKYKATNKIKNYPKVMRKDAIKYLMENNLISIREDRATCTGRTPSYISLTDKGVKKAQGYSDDPEHKSVWSIK